MYNDGVAICSFEGSKDETISRILTTYVSSISLRCFLISLRTLIDSNEKNATPRPLNSPSSLMIHLLTFAYFAMRIVSWFTSSSSLRIFSAPGAVGSLQSSKSFLAALLPSKPFTDSNLPENTGIPKFIPSKLSSLHGMP